MAWPAAATLRVQCTKANRQGNPGLTPQRAPRIAQKLTICGLHHYLCAVAATGATRASCMRSIDLTLPLNRLARMLTSYSVRTRIVVLALIPVAGFLANGLTYVSG